MVQFIGEMASMYRPGESSRSGSSNGDPNHVPRLGGVRCYWALLQPRNTEPAGWLDLSFVHMDPVLGAHLARQKMSLMGRGIMEFIHPHEREQARRDLTSAIAANDLQGSVTRVRFARLSRIKIILGCPPEELDLPDQVQKVVEDDEYLVLDIVINWAADGLLLAFFHAIKDMDPIANNDPARAHEGWSNFCSTVHMSDEAVHAMSEGISTTVRPPSPSRHPPTRIFQLYSNALHSQLLYSWPPSRPVDQPGKLDGLYDASEYTQLMGGVNMDPSVLPAAPGEVRTTCSTRFGAKHSMTSEGVYRLVESVFIPYGDIIFACFQTTRMFELSPRSSFAEHAQDQRVGMGTSGGVGVGMGMATGVKQEQQPLLAYGQGPPPHTPLGPPHTSVPLMMTSSGSTSSPPNMTSPYEQDEKARIRQSLEMVQPDPHPPTHFMPPPSQPHSHPQSYASTPHMDRLHSHSSSSPHGNPPPPPPPPPIANGVNGHADGRPYPPLFSLPPPPGMDLAQQPRTLPMPLVLQPPIPHAPNGHGPIHPPPHAHPLHAMHAMHPPPVESHSPHALSGPHPPHHRPLIRPPDGVECCVMCGTRESPEWRRNETGIKDLCNACGLRLARQINKRNGKQKPRKKKTAAT